MQPRPDPAPEARTTGTADELSIGELSRRTGVSPERLRVWESRHGFPRARRLPSGHRRYSSRTVAEVDAVRRLTASGMQLGRAIDQTTRVAPDASSVHAHLRAACPELDAARVQKRTLIALSHAIEDECCARAEHGSLIGAFQREQHLVAALPRWHDLTRVFDEVLIFSQVSVGLGRRPVPARLAGAVVALDDASPMMREWAVICDTPGLPAALSAWELPGQSGVPDREREFEAIWTLTPQAVRDAARAAVAIARGTTPAAADRLSRRLDATAVATHPDPAATDRLYSRVVRYLDDDARTRS